MVFATDRILYIKVTWTNLATTQASATTPIQYQQFTLAAGHYFKVFVKHNNAIYFTNIYEPGHARFVQADYDDFTLNYKVNIDALPPTDAGVSDGTRPFVHATPRPIGTTSYFSTRSDDDATLMTYGGDVPESKKLKHTHEIGDGVGIANADVKYMDINSIDNVTHLREGYMQWIGCGHNNNELLFEIVPKLTTVSAGSNTFYNVFGGYLVVPAAGDGFTTINDADRVLVEMPPNEFGVRSASFWDADFNTSTAQFENITAAPLGNGKFNMFTVEVPLFRFVNGVSMLGDAAVHIQTNDASQVGHGMRMRAMAITYGTDHKWSWNATLLLYRMKTV